MNKSAKVVLGRVLINRTAGFRIRTKPRTTFLTECRALRKLSNLSENTLAPHSGEVAIKTFAGFSNIMTRLRLVAEQTEITLSHPRIPFQIPLDPATADDYDVGYLPSSTEQ